MNKEQGKKQGQKQEQVKVKDNTYARIYAFKFLYKLQLNPFKDLNNNLIQIKTTNEIDPYLNDFDISFVQQDGEHNDNVTSDAIRSYAKVLLLGVLVNDEKIKEEIKANLRGWSLDKISKTDLTLLLLAICEMKYLKENVPHQIVINEFVNIAKTYGNNESSSFINGLLDNIAKK